MLSFLNSLFILPLNIESGDLYTCGESGDGKLGLGEDVKADTPTKVDLPEKAKWVACGGSHTAVITGYQCYIVNLSWIYM